MKKKKLVIPAPVVKQRIVVGRKTGTIVLRDRRTRRQANRLRRELEDWR